MDASDPVCDGDWFAGDAVDGGGQRGDERFDVAASVQLRQDVKVGSAAARYLPKCDNRVARLLTVLGTQVACLRFK